jgi:tetratricopeptide (TPR) repeat protein
MDTYKTKSRILYLLCLTCLPILIAGLVLGSYTRNIVWATEKRLWQDAIQKAPSLARPYQGFALALEKENRLDEALTFYQKALTLKDPEPTLSRFISLSNMGNIYKKRKAYDKAVQYLTAAVNTETGIYADRVRYNLVLCLLNSQKEKEALTHLEALLTRRQNNGRFLATKGFILLQQGETDAALQHLRQSLKQNPFAKNTLICFAMALSVKKEHKRADWYLRLVRKSHARNLIIDLGLLQNAIKIQDAERISTYLRQLTSVFRLDEITHFFVEHAKGYHYIYETLVPIEDKIILPYLADFFKEEAQRMGNGAIE